MKTLSYKIAIIWFLLLQSTLMYCQNLPIIGFGDAANYSIGHYPVPGSDGLDLHWYGGIRFGDRSGSSVMQITNGNVGIGTTDPYSKLTIGNSQPLFLNSGGSSITPFLAVLNSSNPSVAPYGWAFYDNPTNGNLDIYRRNGTVQGEQTMSFNRNTGDIGIGTKKPDEKLTVKGKIHAEEVKVDLAVPADYVFEKYYLGESPLKPDYALLTLSEVEKFTSINHHLPNLPSAKEIKENGLQLGEMSNMLLQKIEEMTLYIIEQEKKNDKQSTEIETLKKENESYKTLAERLSEIENKLKH